MMNFELKKFFILLGVPLFCVSNVFAQPQKETLAAPGLKSTVEILYDHYGIAHIKAKNLHDVFFAQGYVTAKDRLFQMDFLRRSVSGRLAEILGEGRVEDDYEARQIGLYKVAEEIYKKSGKDLKLFLKAYAEGVNFFIETLKNNLPEEFLILHYVPEPWSPVDGLAFGRQMTFHLSASMGEELTIGGLLKWLGAEKASDFMGILPADPITIVSAQKQSMLMPDRMIEDALAWASHYEKQKEFLGLMDFVGSNNWVVDGKKSVTGHPILCNDPHLGLSSPSIWYDVHLQAPGLNVIGSTFPGTPGILIGHNEDIVWGVTTTGYDVSDLYVETLNPQNPNEYRFNGQWVSMKEEKVVLKYRDGAEMKQVEKVIKSTVHGPVVRESFILYPGKALSFKWTGFEPTFEVETFSKINRAKNLKDFKDALQSFGAGAQNFVYADTKGNIFYMAPSRVPIRPKGCVPYMPISGEGDCEWQGFIPYSELPQAENPREHFVATANNRPAPWDYPYYIGLIFDIGYRAKRITQRLTEKEKLTFEEVQDVQGDAYSLPAENTKDILLKALPYFDNYQNTEISELHILKQAAEAIKSWDNVTSENSVGASLYHKWLKFMAKNILSKHFPGEMFQYVGSVGDVTISLLVKSKQKGAFKYDWFGDMDRVAFQSFVDAVKELRTQFGDNVQGWIWGKLHSLTLRHPVLSHIPSDETKKWHMGPYPRHGAIDTVDNAGFGLLGEFFDFGGGPSLRMCTEAKPGMERSENVITGGQSSSPESPHFSDQMKLWLQNKARPQYFTEKSLKKEGVVEKILILAPE